jgi:O-antigen/teichoic acid export membrane protein
MKRSVSSAFFVLSTVALALTALFAALYQVLPWGRLLKLGDAGLTSEAALVILICFLVCFVNIPLGIIQRTQMAMQEGYIRNLWEGLGSLANILVIIVAVRLEASLPMLVLAVSGFGLFITLLNGGLYYHSVRRDLLPLWRFFDWDTGKRLLHSGSHFVLMSLATGFVLHSDTTWVAMVLGLEAAATFSVPARLAAILGSIVSMLVMPLWPASGEALARGDAGWVRRNTSRMQNVTLVLTASAGVLFVAFGGWALKLWIGPEFEISRSLLAALAVWAVVISYVSPLFMVLNSAGKTWEQVRLFAVFVPVATVCKVVLLQQIGVAGVIWGTLVPYVLLMVIPVNRIASNVLSGYAVPQGQEARS